MIRTDTKYFFYFGIDFFNMAVKRTKKHVDGTGIRVLKVDWLAYFKNIINCLETVSDICVGSCVSLLLHLTLQGSMGVTFLTSYQILIPQEV